MISSIYERILTDLYGHGLPIFASIGSKSASVINSVSKEMKLPIIAAVSLAVLWGAFGYVISGEEGTRAAKKRWKQAFIGLAVALGVWYLVSWATGKLNGIF